MTIEEFYQGIKQSDHREIVKKMIKDLHQAFPDLQLQIKWKQPMFVKDGAFILGVSVSKGHLSISPDKYTLDIFKDLLEDRGYQVKKMLFSIKWNQEVDMDLLKEIVAFNIEDRAGSKTFWR